MIKKNIFKCADGEIVNPVQHDGSNRSHPETRLSHPEFISGSQKSRGMLKQVQYDDHPTRQASNPAQYNGWCRTSLSIGRSMIEMLGVLAIIGVLSIGGLYAYRQAMDRYHMNEIFNIFRLSQQAILEKCIMEDNCIFHGKTETEIRSLMCQFIGTPCESTLKYGGSWRLTVVSYPSFVDEEIVLRSLSKALCHQIVEYSWHPLHYMEVTGSNPQKTTNGVLSEAQKEFLKKECETHKFIRLFRRYYLKDF